MKTIKYYCDEDAPNYVLDEDVCIDTSIVTDEEIKVSRKDGNLIISLTAKGKLKIYSNYAWDGATGIPDSRRNMFASLVHDALYQIMRECYKLDHSQIGIIDRKVFRKKVDKLYEKLCLKNGVSKFFASLAYAGIRLLAKQATQRTNDKSYWDMEAYNKICTAPAKGATDCS